MSELASEPSARSELASEPSARSELAGEPSARSELAGEPSARSEPSAHGCPRLRAALRDAWQVLRGIAGERAYENYLAHQAAHHPREPVLSEREFWRVHVDRADRVPSARCC